MVVVYQLIGKADSQMSCMANSDGVEMWWSCGEGGDRRSMLILESIGSLLGAD